MEDYNNSQSWFILSDADYQRINNDLNQTPPFEETVPANGRSSAVRYSIQRGGLMDTPTQPLQAPKAKEPKKEVPKEDEITYQMDPLGGNAVLSTSGWSIRAYRLTCKKEGITQYTADLSGYGGNCSILVMSCATMFTYDNFKKISEVIKDIIKLIEEDTSEIAPKIRNVVNQAPSIIEYTSASSSIKEQCIKAGFVPVFEYNNYTSGNTITKLVYAVDMSKRESSWNRNRLNFSTINQK